MSSAVISIVVLPHDIVDLSLEDSDDDSLFDVDFRSVRLKFLC